MIEIDKPDDLDVEQAQQLAAKVLKVLDLDSASPSTVRFALLTVIVALMELDGIKSFGMSTTFPHPKSVEVTITETTGDDESV